MRWLHIVRKEVESYCFDFNDDNNDSINIDVFIWRVFHIHSLNALYIYVIHIRCEFFLNIFEGIEKLLVVKNSE